MVIPKKRTVRGKAGESTRKMQTPAGNCVGNSAADMDGDLRLQPERKIGHVVWTDRHSGLRWSLPVRHQAAREEMERNY